jgi:hypothetical protein
LALIYNKNNGNYDPIKNEINKLKEEINKLKKFHEKKNPKDMKSYSIIADDSFVKNDLDNTFTVFKSIDGILSLIYADKNNSIICYDINERKKNY